MLSHHLDPGTSVAHTEVPQCVGGGVFIITKEGFLSPGGAHIFLADESFKLSHPGCRSLLIQAELVRFEVTGRWNSYFRFTI